MVQEEHHDPPAGRVQSHHLATIPALVSPGNNDLTHLETNQLRSTAALQLLPHCCQVLVHNLGTWVNAWKILSRRHHLAGLQIHLAKHLDEPMLLLNMSYKKLKWFGV